MKKMGSKGKPLAIIIPAKNEQQTIISTLEQIKKKVRTKHDVLVVNGCSDDETETLVKKYSKQNRNVFLINTQKNKSDFSNSIRAGVMKAETDFIVIIMADLCDNLKTVDIMFRKIEKGWDVVCGSRYRSGGKKIGGPKLQGFFSKLVCISLYFLTGIPTRDVSNAFKMYRRKVIERLHFPAGGVEVSMYLLLQAYFNGAKITEVPTFWRGRILGDSKFKLLERFPRYLRIYFWAIENSVKMLIK